MRLRAPWSVGVAYAKTGTGRTTGYRATPQCCGDFVFLNSKIQTVAAIVGVSSRNLQIGIGPALHRTSMQASAGQGGTTNQTKLGAILQGRASISARALLFVVKGEYRYIGRADVGPFVPEVDTDGMAPFSARVNYTHLYLGVGVGVRF